MTEELKRNQYGMLSFDDALILVEKGLATVRYQPRLDALVVYEYKSHSPTGVTSCAFAKDTKENRAKVSRISRVNQANSGF